MILSKQNRDGAQEFLHEVIEMGIDFKLQNEVKQKPLNQNVADSLLEELPLEGMELNDLLNEFKSKILPYCTNFSSPKFMGFPDAGNSVAGIGGAITSDLLQQNLINQSFCAPAATYTEIATIQWLREIIGYQNEKPSNIWDVGGIIMPGGTGSNSVAMMLARENHVPGTMTSGIHDPEKFKIIVPKGIGHYSVKSAQMWIGCGNNLVEVETDNFRYNLKELEEAIIKYREKIMCVVAYAGDSRTMTIDKFREIHDIVRTYDERIWLHADACHGFCLGFSDKLRDRIDGLNLFDSVTVDPHKVLLVPYTISALLVKQKDAFKKVTSLSDLIMQEQYAFGQITPFIGSKPWQSLKLWFAMKNLGKNGLGELIERRHAVAKLLEKKLQANANFIVINDVQINSVAFLYVGCLQGTDIEKINEINRIIHDRLQEEGKFHLHQFSIPDSGNIERGKIIYPLRFMSGNPNICEEDLDAMIEHVLSIGASLLNT